MRNTIERHIRPENEGTFVVEVQRDGVLQVIEQQCVLGAVRKYPADVNAVGKEQNWLRTYTMQERRCTLHTGQEDNGLSRPSDVHNNRHQLHDTELILPNSLHYDCAALSFGM